MKTLLVGVSSEVEAILQRDGATDQVPVDELDDFFLSDWLVDFHDQYNFAIINLDVVGSVLSCKELRNKRCTTPVVGLITQGENNRAEQRVQFLNNGGDDLLSNPVNLEELVATKNAIMRRTEATVSTTVAYRFKDFTIRYNARSRFFYINDTHIDFTEKERKVMLGLFQRPNTLLSKDAILLYVYQEQDEPEIKIVDVFICKMRRKLQACGLDEDDVNNLISTVWGEGYMLKVDTSKQETKADEV